MAQMRAFVSHSHKDNAFCLTLVGGLSNAGVDVWYDNESMGAGQLSPIIERELDRRPIFIVALSPSALTSRWVEDETRWAYILLRRDPARIILPVLAKPLSSEDDIWLFLRGFKRIEAPGLRPYPRAKAVAHTLHALQLVQPGEVPQPSAPQQSESAADLLMRGRAMLSQGRFDESAPLFQRAVQLDPRSFYAWANLGVTLGKLNRHAEAFTAYEKALALDPDNAAAAGVWSNKGNTLDDLGRADDALAAYDRALALDPHNAKAWYNKGWVLDEVKRYNEAIDAYDFALTLAPDNKAAWDNKGETLNALGRFDEALVCLNRALEIDPNLIDAWRNRAVALRALARMDEANEADRRVQELTSASS